MKKVRKKRLAPQDATWVYSESSSNPEPMRSGFAFVFDVAAGGHPRSVGEVAKWLGERLSGAPGLSRAVWRVPLDLDHPYWCDVEDFDPSAHVAVWNAPGPGWDRFHEVLGEVLYSPLDLTRPMWDLHLINDVRDVPGFPPQAVVVVLRIHHALADGMSRVALARVLFSRTPPDHARPVSVEAPSAAAAILRGIGKLPAQIRYLSGLAQLLWTSNSEIVGDRGRVYPRTRFNMPIRGRGAVARVRLDLPEVKEIGRRLGTYTVNDVLLATIAGTLRSYLIEIGELPPAPLAATVPKSLRTAQEAGGGDIGPGNVGVTMAVSLCTDVSDPVERLSKIQVAADAAKQWALGSTVAKQRALIEIAPAPVVSWTFRPREKRLESVSLDQPRTIPNTHVTNIPVGAPDFFFGEAPVAEAFLVSAIGPGQGLTHAVNSLGDGLSVTVTVDDHAMPDVQHYAELLRNSYEELARAAGLR